MAPQEHKSGTEGQKSQDPLLGAVKIQRRLRRSKGRKSEAPSIDCSIFTKDWGGSPKLGEILGLGHIVSQL